MRRKGGNKKGERKRIEMWAEEKERGRRKGGNPAGWTHLGFSLRDDEEEWREEKEGKARDRGKIVQAKVRKERWKRKRERERER